MSNSDFEGLEKHIIINFENKETSNSCRNLLYQDLTYICEQVQCTIISTLKNEYFDSYILSESSLFVYPFQIILMSCGSTTLLKAIKIILKLVKDKLSLNPISVIYYRNKFLFEEKQLFPHQSIVQELNYLEKNTEIKKISNNDYHRIIGDIDSDYLLIYENKSNNILKTVDNIIKIMIYNIDSNIGNLFYSNNKSDLKLKIIKDILPSENILIDSYNFEPCGLSVNALIDNFYCTIHITPNSNCSYISYETNFPIDNPINLIKNIANIFKGTKIIINQITNARSNILPLQIDNYNCITKSSKINDYLYCNFYKLD